MASIEETAGRLEQAFRWLVRLLATFLVVSTLVGIWQASETVLDSSSPSGQSFQGIESPWNEAPGRDALERALPAAIEVARELARSEYQATRTKALEELTQIVGHQKEILANAANGHLELLKLVDAQNQRREEERRANYKLVVKEVVVEPLTRLLFALLALAGINVGGQLANNALQVRAKGDKARIRSLSLL